MRSAIGIPDQSSSGGVSPARNTRLVMTRRGPASDGMLRVYHSIRYQATARSGAPAEPPNDGAAAHDAWFGGNLASDATRRGPPNQPEPNCIRFVSAGLSNLPAPAPTVHVATTGAKGKGDAQAPILSQRA